MPRLVAAPAFLLSLTLASCTGAPERKPTFPVTGRVTDAGKPVANATVILHPADAADPLRPRGVTGPDGGFTLTTYEGADGAPAGEYRVTVEQWLGGKRPEDGPANRLPAKYGKPESSGLTATVTAGPTELKPIEIKR